MNISASDVKDGKLTATVTVPAADVDAAIKKAYKEAAKKYRFPGFRPGRAPRPVIDSALGKEAVLAQATNDLLGATEPSVLNELDIVPVKQGDYNDVDLVADGTDYTYTATFPLRPAPELSSYEPVAIEMPPAEVTEGEIDAQVEMLMGYHATFEDAAEDHPAAEGDMLTLDVENIEGGESLAGTDRPFMVGGTAAPDGMENGIKGMKAGETKEIEFPVEHDDHTHDVKVKVTVKTIKERKLPELTDEFAKTNFGFDDIAAMRDAIKGELEQDKASKLPGIKENRCVAELAKRLQLDEMDPDYEQSIFSELGQNFLSSLSQRGMTLDTWLQANGMSSEQFVSDLHHQADDVARESLALDALARELKVEVTDEDVDQEFASAGVKDAEASKKQFIAEGRMPAVRDSIRRSKAVDWLVENAQVTEVDEYAKDAEGEGDAEAAEKAADAE